jgi:hypothetical protein
MRIGIASLVLLVTTGALARVATPAAAQDEHPSEARAARPTPPLWEGEIAYRDTFVSDRGYAALSPNASLDQFSLSLSRGVYRRGRLEFSVGAGWDYGRAESTARGAPSSLTLHRLSAPLTARYALTPWLDVFGRVAPAIASQAARVEESSAPAPLVASAWLPAGDASAGAAWRFAWTEGPGASVIGWWLMAEGGYAWTSSMSLALSPDLPSGDPRRTGTTDLGSVAMSGPFVRVGVSMSFW